MKLSPVASESPAIALAAAVLTAVVGAQEPASSLDELEARLGAVEAEGRELREQIAAERAARLADAERHAAETEALLDELDAMGAGAADLGGDDWYDRLSLSGYGEHHFQITEGGGGDVADIHRFVLYLGYDFDDWIQLHSETEVEHGFVADDDGEVSIEQLYVDLLLEDSLNVRIGRVLAPLGIVNRIHEPPTFNGVERPNVERVVIPTTWSLDGAGLHGRLGDELAYELYVTGGLDGSRFDDLDGIRGGRIKERPSLNDPALSGRLDWRPFGPAGEHDLRLGTSFFAGGIDNGNKGADPGLDGSLTLVSADFEYSTGDWDFRGVIARGTVSGAGALNAALAGGGPDPGIADGFLGWYVEGAYHVMPEGWKSGKLERSDLVAFARFEDYDTQESLPPGATANPAAARQDVTVGVTFFLTPQVVLKADYQFLDDDTELGVRDRLNFGLGWRL